MQWPPDAKLDGAALKAASQEYVKHLLDGAHEDMAVLVIVVNRKTGQLHYAWSDGQADAKNVLIGALNATQSPIAVPHRV